MIILYRNQRNAWIRRCEILRRLVKGAAIHRQAIDLKRQAHGPARIEVEKIKGIKAAFEFCDTNGRIRPAPAGELAEIDTSDVQVEPVVRCDTDLMHARRNVDVSEKAEGGRTHLKIAVPVDRRAVVFQELGDRGVAIARPVTEFRRDKSCVGCARRCLLCLFYAPDSCTGDESRAQETRANRRYSDDLIHAHRRGKTSRRVDLGCVEKSSRIHCTSLPLARAVGRSSLLVFLIFETRMAPRKYESLQRRGSGKLK